MNLDEMLAASGITGGAAATDNNVKSGFVTLIGRLDKKLPSHQISRRQPEIEYRLSLPTREDKLCLSICLESIRRRINLANIW